MLVQQFSAVLKVSRHRRKFSLFRAELLHFPHKNESVSSLDSKVLLFPVSDSTDIVDGKLKLILGLIWTLILHYSISMPMWEGDDDLMDKDRTPKQRLLEWIQNKIPDRPIRNFTSDWNDGTNIGALVDACAPGEWNFFRSVAATSLVGAAFSIAPEKAFSESPSYPGLLDTR